MHLTMYYIMRIFTLIQIQTLSPSTKAHIQSMDNFILELAQLALMVGGALELSFTIRFLAPASSVHAGFNIVFTVIRLPALFMTHHCLPLHLINLW